MARTHRIEKSGYALKLILQSKTSTLRVGLGQNGQKGFISGEQLSLNVAGDSAKTRSVLGNVGGCCRWSWPQICAEVAAPSSKYPRFWGPNGFFQIISKNTPLAFDYTRPYMPPRCHFHSDIPPRPPNTKKMALKKPQGGRNGRDRPCRAMAPFFWYIGENEITSPLGVFSARFRERCVCGCI